MSDIYKINFDNRETSVVLFKNQVYVIMASLVPNLNVSWSGQRRKIVTKKLNIYNFSYLYVYLLECASFRRVVCIPLEDINFFLQSINIKKIPNIDIIEKIELYKSDFYSFASEEIEKLAKGRW